MNRRLICAFGLVSALFVLGCSDSGDSGGSTGGTTTTSTGGTTTTSTGGTTTTSTGGTTTTNTGGTTSSSTGGTTGASTCETGMDTTRASTSPGDACCLLCVKEEPCNPTSPLDLCAGPDGYKHCAEAAAAPAACGEALRAYYDCLREEPDVCMPTAACDDLSVTAADVCDP